MLVWLYVGMVTGTVLHHVKPSVVDYSPIAVQHRDVLVMALLPHKPLNTPVFQHKHELLDL